jgi:hypothetical protein
MAAYPAALREGGRRTELASIGSDTAADSHTTATGKTRATEPYELPTCLAR